MFEISRRDLIVGAAGAYAAFGLDRPIAFIGAAQAQTTPAAPGPCVGPLRPLDQGRENASDTVRHCKRGPAYTPPDPETTRQRKRA